jgi:hypothetical protein
MSARLNALAEFPDYPRQIQLVRGLIEKARQGKIGWVKLGTAFTASLPNGIVVNFVLTAAKGGMTWQLFTVRDKQGNELVRVEPQGYMAPVALGPDTINTLVDATSELFAIIRGAASDDLDRAIESLKNL